MKTLDEFITERTRIISEMLDNPSQNEIYPTAKCFEQLDLLFKEYTLPWIKVADRLPEVNQKIDLWLVPDDERKPKRMLWTWEKDQTEKTTIAGCKVTHWMPYTEPPKV